MRTSNYDSFKFFPTNRPIVTGKVNRFKDSFNKIGYIEAFPILTDEHKRIIDGQHRFVALKEMGLEIIYKIDDSGVDPEILMIELNKVQDVWRLSVYVHHFAEKGVAFHKEVRSFEDRHRLGISNSIIACSVTRGTA